MIKNINFKRFLPEILEKVNQAFKTTPMKVTLSSVLKIKQTIAIFVFLAGGCFDFLDVVIPVSVESVSCSGKYLETFWDVKKVSIK